MTFDGIQLVIKRGLFDSHSLLMVATSNISVNFGSIFGGTKQVGSGNFNPLLIDDFDHCLNITTNVNVLSWNNLKIKLNTRVINYLIIIHCLKIIIFIYVMLITIGSRFQSIWSSDNC